MTLFTELKRRNVFRAGIAFPFEYAKLVAPRSRELVVCDPMASGAWRSEVETMIWSGDPEPPWNQHIKVRNWRPESG